MSRHALLAACALALTVAGMAPTEVSAAPLPAAAAAERSPVTHTITMAAMAFGAVPDDVRAGDRIEWINNDVLEHTATARDGSFDVHLKPGAKAVITVKQAGSFPFVCTYHPNMVGTLVVH